MTTKSVLDIDINDQEFKRFAELFKKYNDQLKQSGKTWGDINKNVGDISDETADTLKTLAQWNIINERLNKLEQERRKNTEATASAWKRIAYASKDVGRTTLDTARTLIRWGGLGGLTAGLLGAGGLFGLDRLSGSVGAGRRSALGLGTSYGGFRAFGAAYGRLVDPGAFLGGLAEAKGDVTQRRALYGLGVNRIEGRDTTDLALETLTKLKAFADRTPEATWGRMVEALQLGQLGIGTEELRRIRATPQAELGEYARTFAEGRSNADLQDQNAKAWQDLTAVLHNAENAIETVFAKSLVGLSGPLQDLSKAFVDTAKILLEGPEVGNVIKDIGEGMKAFAVELKSGEFQKNVKAFMADVGTLVRGIDWIINHIPGLKSFSTAGGAAVGAAVGSVVPGVGTAAGAVVGGGLGYAYGQARAHEQQIKSADRALQGFLLGQPTIPNQVAVTPSQFLRKTASRALGFGSLEGRYGLPTGLLNAVYGAESSFGRNLLSPKGAQGPFQFMPKTASMLGLTDPYDLGKASEAAARYLRELISKFGGDLAKGLAAYNWGEGNVRRDVSKYGADWFQHVPAETRGYVIKIMNNTGGSAIVSASAVAGP